jgi:hypothetical protein
VLVGQRALLLLAALMSIMFVAGRAEAAAEAAERVRIIVGHNWTLYSRSTITFSGPGYELRLEDVTAHDQPYFELPLDAVQIDVRVDVALGNNNFFTFGFDHLKYVVGPQTVAATGHVAREVSAPFAGRYDGEDLSIGGEGDAIGWFEHTDGLNYLAVGLRHRQPLASAPRVATVMAVEAGPALLNTDTSVLGRENDKKYHLGGFGLDGVLGVELDISEHLFAEATFKGGRMVVLDALTLPDERAHHAFWFAQGALAVGVRF